MNSKNRRVVLASTVFLLVLFVFSEIVLRKVYGFTDAVLYKSDRYFEYIPIAQKRYKFRKKIYYNRFSQRSREVLVADSNIILGFGDSVINGGDQTDQDSLATSRLTQYLTSKYHKNVLVANISAGSWGPDNCFAYLQRYGNFGAKKMMLIVSSHDAYDNMEFTNIVGRQPNYPAQQYSLALIELVDRYLFPRLRQSIKWTNYTQSTGGGDSLVVNKYRIGAEFNRGFTSFQRYSQITSIPLIIYLHADQNELKNRRYNHQGQEIIAFCQKNSVFLIKELDFNFQTKDYRDDIHLSERGQYHLYAILKKYL